jgi:DNA-binding PadR family transcriptional regulator
MESAMSPRSSSPLTLEYVLLALLDVQPLHGYELYQELQSMAGIAQIWVIKQSLLYADLDKLERIGYLASQLGQSENAPPRKYFQLTARGKSALDDWRNTPVRKARNLRQEFLAKLIIARKYGQGDALELIHRQRTACQAWLAELQVQEASPVEMDEWLVVSFRIGQVQGVLKWLQACEERIKLDY